MNEVLLKDITFVGQLIKDWPYIEVEGYQSRVYYRVNETEHEDNGFDFYIVETTGCMSAKEEDEWNPEYCLVECLFNGHANWEGMKHLYMGDEKTLNYGYLYYTEPLHLIEVLNVLNILEKKHCKEIKNRYGL